MTRQSHDAKALARCIARCAAAKDNRGRWRAEGDCTASLSATGSPATAAAAAAAARAVGAHLAALATTPQQAAAAAR